MSGSRRQDVEEAWKLAGDGEVYLAGVVDGRPVLDLVRAVARGGALELSGSPSLAALAGRPVVLSAVREVARLPAARWTRGARARGTLEAADGAWRVRAPELEVVEDLGQDLAAEALREVLRELWRRGGPGDLAAIELAAAAHPDRPPFAEVPTGLRPRCSPTEADARAAVALIAEEYWNVGFPRERLLAAHRACGWVGLEASDGLLATARLLSDRGKRAWIYDVGVRADARGKGVGHALIRLALDHPDLRAVTEVWLATRDADPFYERHGFVTVRLDEGPPFRRATMVRRSPQQGSGRQV